MEHALPRRTWSLCMTSENHGTVGPAGCKFSHAPEKHERVQVVEIVPAGSPPAPGVDLSGLMRFGFCDINDDEFVERPDGAYFLAHQVEERVTSAPAAKPVGEFKGYVDGQPAVTWFDRDNMPRVGTKLFAGPFESPSEPVGAGIDTPEFRERLRGLGATFSAHGDAYKLLVGYVNRRHLLAAQAGQVAVPGWTSVDDRLPEFRHECTSSGCEVSDSLMVYGQNEFGTTGCGFGHAREDGTWATYEAEYDQLTVVKVTHWMPLPAAPSPAKESK